MNDVFTIAKVLLDNAVQNYGQEVDIIAYSGSYARGDAVAAHAEAMLLQHDVTATLYQTTAGVGHSDFNLYSELATMFREFNFPDLMKITSSSLEDLAEQARLFDERFRWFLSEHLVDLCEIKTLDELRAVFL
ncbi:hypothetical protein ACFL27_10675 [candidate division CSSED10-310 bacterium]|uniref:Uncharacterized protein n=1 Tax=candidate division CSSED10-310 bacterium TaxID=2855610 RepID=A0ABV6YWQ8_UNCC1